MVPPPKKENSKLTDISLCHSHTYIYIYSALPRMVTWLHLRAPKHTHRHCCPSWTEVLPAWFLHSIESNKTIGLQLDHIILGVGVCAGVWKRSLRLLCVCVCEVCVSIIICVWPLSVLAATVACGTVLEEHVGESSWI